MSNEEVIDKLLHSEEPSIRLRARVEILGESIHSQLNKTLQEEVSRSDRVRLLLSERNKDGTIPFHPYAKWYGAHWVLASLADLHYPKSDASLAPLREQVYDWLMSKTHLDYTKNHETYAGPVVRVRGLYRAHASMEGNALYYLSALGMTDERTQVLADRLVEWQWPDGGWNCDKRSSAHTSSFTESLLPLRGLAIFSSTTKKSYRECIESAGDYFLQRKLFKRKRDGRVMNSKFLKLHYPLYWHYDILFALKVMKESGFGRDERCNDAVSILKSKKLEDGGFPAEEAYYRVSSRAGSGRSLVGWGRVSKTKMNEFVTCDALSILKL
jgi:hypothetical protein